LHRRTERPLLHHSLHHNSLDPGFPTPKHKRIKQLPLLLDGISTRATQHASMALRCATTALAALGPKATASAASVSAMASGVASGPATAHLLPTAPADRAVLLDHLTKLLLYQRPLGDRVLTPLAAAQGAAAAAAAAAAGPAPPAPAALPPPAGLSAADVTAFEEKGVLEQWELVRRKLGALQLISGATEGSPVLTSGAGSGAANGGSSTLTRASSSGGAGASGESNSNSAAVQDGAEAGAADGGGGGNAAALLTPSEVLIPLLVAACDPSEPVSK